MGKNLLILTLVSTSRLFSFSLSLSLSLSLSHTHTHTHTHVHYKKACVSFWEGFPGGLDGKESAYNAGYPGSFPE